MNHKYTVVALIESDDLLSPDEPTTIHTKATDWFEAAYKAVSEFERSGVLPQRVSIVSVLYGHAEAAALKLGHIYTGSDILHVARVESKLENCMSI